jgi:hypothetical protein
MARSDSVQIDPIDLEVIEDGKEYLLVCQDEPILTQHGHQVRRYYPIAEPYAV